jgi:hypothetical protein
VAFAAGAALSAYAGHAAWAWFRYGRPAPPNDHERDVLLDQFMPAYDVVERHAARVHAPADAVFAAACEQNLQASPVTRAIFRTREIVLGAKGAPPRVAKGLLREVMDLGWGVLAEVPGREVVVAAVTRPWEADVTFRAIDPAAFASFDRPGYVKIAWTLRADPIGPSDTMFLTETRAVATDAAARRKFRLYWALFSPGITLIRRLSLGPLARDAVRRGRLPATRRS